RGGRAGRLLDRRALRPRPWEHAAVRCDGAARLGDGGARAQHPAAGRDTPPVKKAATRPLPGPAWDELDDVVVGERPDAEILIVMNEPVPFDAYPALRLVANFSVGYDRIDVDACRGRGIAVTNTPGVLDAAVADLTMALVLAVRRRVAEGDRTIRAGGWA